MRLITDTQDRIRIVALGGEIDLHFAPVLTSLLKQKTTVRTETLILDLSEVTFIDSRGVAAILAHLRTARREAKTFCIGGMSNAVKTLFEVIHLDKAMPVFATREAARRAAETRQIAEPPRPLFAA